MCARRGSAYERTQVLVVDCARLHGRRRSPRKIRPDRLLVAFRMIVKILLAVQFILLLVVQIEMSRLVAGPRTLLLDSGRHMVRVSIPSSNLPNSAASKTLRRLVKQYPFGSRLTRRKISYSK